MPTSEKRRESPAQKQLSSKITELKSKEHLPAPLVSLVARVAELQLAALETVNANGLVHAAANALLPQIPGPQARQQGAFMARPRDFPLDAAVAEELLPAVLAALAANGEPFVTLKDELEQDLLAKPALLEKACRESMREAETGAAENAPQSGPANDDWPLRAWEARHPEAPSLLRFAARSAIMPSLAAAAAVLGQEHPGDKAWPHGHCPLCGSLPLMGALCAPDGLRRHCCSFCSFEYRVPRLGCAFCGRAHAEGAEYYSTGDEPGYLLDACPTCKNYLKLADFREFDRAWLPLLDDLGSLTLDMYARQMGYNRPTLSAWGF